MKNKFLAGKRRAKCVILVRISQRGSWGIGNWGGNPSCTGEKKEPLPLGGNTKKNREKKKNPTPWLEKKSPPTGCTVRGGCFYVCFGGEETMTKRTNLLGNQTPTQNKIWRAKVIDGVSKGPGTGTKTGP